MQRTSLLSRGFLVLAAIQLQGDYGDFGTSPEHTEGEVGAEQAGEACDKRRSRLC